MFKFTIYGRLPTLNEYTKVSRSNKYASASIKSNAEKEILTNIALTKTGEAKPPYFITFMWRKQNAEIRTMYALPRNSYLTHSKKADI